jgi:hypothetical protein
MSTIGKHWYAGSPNIVSTLHISPIRALLYNFDAENLSAFGSFLQLFDNIAAPVLLNVPTYSYLVGPGQLLAVQVPGPNNDQGRLFVSGIWAAWSSTPEFYTPTAAIGPINASGRYRE